MNITRLECKDPSGVDVVTLSSYLNITRLECKVFQHFPPRLLQLHLNITRLGLRYNRDTEEKA